MDPSFYLRKLTIPEPLRKYSLPEQIQKFNDNVNSGFLKLKRRKKVRCNDAFSANLCITTNGRTTINSLLS